MAAIKTNTPNLEEILATVNSLPTQTVVQLQEKSVTPSASAQIVTPDSGYTGLSQVNVSGDSNLVASNIVSGKTIFGVAGSASTGVEVKTANGSAKTSSSGKLTLNIGFKPDLICIQVGTINGYECNLNLALTEKWTTSPADCVSWYGDEYMYEAYVDNIGTTSSTVYIYGYDSSMNSGAASNITFNWKAVKYTA